ncbi:MAG: ATP-binding protein [Candidatus Aenigmarchaeota archaeon]|nr:ATP-binding protein [Candidatus Aenigmarchaeota archaeon]
MIKILVGEVDGRTTTHSFKVKAYRDIKKMDFVVAKSDDDKWTLAQISEINVYPDNKIIANCSVLGRREDGLLKVPRMPIKPASLVYQASEDQIRSTLSLKEKGMYIGMLESTTSVKFYIDPDDAITKHIAILAQTGAGKSYTVGVLIEELLEKDIAVLVIDPHGEYASMNKKNIKAKEKDLEYYGVKTKAYEVNEYTPDKSLNKKASKLSFSDVSLSPMEIMSLFPTKPTPTQTAILYGAINELKGVKENYTLVDVINNVQASESNTKWNLVNLLELAKSSDLFSKHPTPLPLLVKRGVASVVNLKGVNERLQQMSITKLLETLFDARKKGQINPLFLVIEEAHNFCPEREVVSTSKIIRTLVSEGRKFGFGVGIVSQRPARVDKNVLSQCNTQIILRVKNPNDLKAISYAEGITKQAEAEIKNLASGTALVLGCEIPLFVNVRTRRTAHGGETQSLLEPKNKTTKEGIKKYFKISDKYKNTKRADAKCIFVPCYEIRINNNLFLFDAIKGNLLFKINDKIENVLLKLSADEKKITGVLIEDNCTKEELFKKINLSFSDFSHAIISLREKGIIREESNMILFCLKTIDEMQKEDFDKAEFGFDSEFLEVKILGSKILDNLGITKKADISLVYYPYISLDNKLSDATLD